MSPSKLWFWVLACGITGSLPGQPTAPWTRLEVPPAAVDAFRQEMHLALLVVPAYVTPGYSAAGVASTTTC